MHDSYYEPESEPNPFDGMDVLADVYGKSLTDVLHEDDYILIGKNTYIAKEAVEGDVSRLAHGDVTFKWGRKGFGFGEFRFGVNEQTGEPFVDTETMNPAFCLDVVIRALTPLLEADNKRWHDWFEEREAKKKTAND